MTEIVGVAVDTSTTRHMHALEVPVPVCAPDRRPGWDVAATVVNAAIRPLLALELQRTFSMGECLIDVTNARTVPEAVGRKAEAGVDVVVGERLHAAGLYAVAPAICVVHESLPGAGGPGQVPSSPVRPAARPSVQQT